MIGKYDEPRPKKEWSGKSVVDRRGWLKNMYIQHPRVVTALNAVAEKVTRAKEKGMGDGIFVLGEPGSGKSAFINYIKEKYTDLFDVKSDEITMKPVIQVSIPDICTRKQFMVNVMAGLGADQRGTYEELIRRASILFNTCKVQIVLVDDLQDVPARRSMRGVNDIAICFRDLIDKTSAVFVLCGNKDALIVLDGNTQMRKRIPFRTSLHYFDLKKVANRPAFVNLILELEKWIPLAESSWITKPSVMEMMYFASGGIFQYLISLLDLAWPLSLKAGREYLNIDDLSGAYVKLYGDIANEVNPFEAMDDRRILNKMGEPFHAWVKS